MMTPAKVLYVCGGRNFHVKNPGRKIRMVAECWRRLGHNIKHVCGGDVGAGGSVPEFGSPSFHSRWYRKVPALAPFIHSVSEFRDIRHDTAMSRHLATLCESFKPDLVWERSARLHSAGIAVARRLRVPYVLEWKDNIAAYNLSLFLSRARSTEAYKNREADYIVVESDALKRGLAAQGLPAGKILVAHNAVDLSEFTRDISARGAMRSNLGAGDDVTLVGYLGSFAWYHDTPLLVEAMRILRNEGDRRIRCVMVGQGEQHEQTRSLAERYGLLGSDVIMLPSVKLQEVPAVLSGLDVAVLPGSTDIICPIKIQEFMAAELATVAPDYPCNREVMTDGGSGALFTPGDASALAKQLQKLASDPALRLRLGSEARRTVERRFTWEATWGNALEQVIADTRARGTQGVRDRV